MPWPKNHFLPNSLSLSLSYFSLKNFKDHWIFLKSLKIKINNFQNFIKKYQFQRKNHKKNIKKKKRCWLTNLAGALMLDASTHFVCQNAWRIRPNCVPLAYQIHDSCFSFLFFRWLLMPKGWYMDHTKNIEVTVNPNENYLSECEYCFIAI